MATADPQFNLISSERIEGTKVFDSSGDTIGKIDHLMIDRVSGMVHYAVMSFGGFLNLGHSHYPLPWSALRYDSAREGYVTNVTEQQLKDAPEFSDDSWSDRDWESQVHRHYRAQPYWEQGLGASGVNSMPS
jgi:PRC-barrel domain